MKILYFWKIFFEICQIRCIVDKTRKHIVCFILKMGGMEASGKSMPACTNDETLKEILNYNRA